MDELEVKYFGGAVTAFQPKEGYRAGTDALLLAASLCGKPRQHFLELGVGSGAVTLLAAHHNPDCRFSGLENNKDMLALARKNTALNKNIEITEGSISSLPKDWHLKFDHVFTNPPFFDKRSAVRMSEVKAPSFVNDAVGIEGWINAMLLALKPRGYGTLIYRADSIEKVIVALAGKAGRLRILPIHSFTDEPAKRALIQFRKGVKSESALLPALVLHERGGAEKFSSEVVGIINGATRLSL